LKDKLKKNIKQNPTGKNISLRKKLSLYIGGTIAIAIIILSSAILKISEKALTNSVIYKFQAEVNGISETLNYMTKSELEHLSAYGRDTNLINLLNSKLTTVKSGNSNIKTIQNQFNEIFKVEISNDENVKELFVINKDGIVYASSNTSLLYQDVSNEDYFQKIKNGEDTVLGDIGISKITGETTNIIARAIRDQNGNYVGIIAKDLNSSIYKKILDKYTEGSFYPFIFDTNGNLVAHNNPEKIGNPLGVETIDEIAKADDLEEGTIEYEYQGEQKIAAYATIPGVGWKVFSAGLIKDIRKPVTAMIKVTLFISILVMVITLITTYLISKGIINPIIKLTNDVKKISEGDLTVKVTEIRTRDEIEQLSKAFKEMVNNLSTLINDVSKTVIKVDDASTNLNCISEEVTASNTQITEAVNEIASSISEQAGDAEKCALRTKELGDSIEELENKNITMEKQSVEVSKALKDNSTKINYLVDSNNKSQKSFVDVRVTVEKLIEHVSSISNIVNVIDNISKQTSLLSLNASIESARAGEAGKGFAVVASEIRTLADDVQGATNDIFNIIRDIEGTVNSTKLSLEESQKLSGEQQIAFKDVEESFNNMGVSLVEMVNITGDISKGIEGITVKKDEVLSSITQVAAAAQEVAALTEEINASVTEQEVAFKTITSSSEGLMGLSQEVKESINQFKI
jgi:methyl-accepting chemotaxis protein